MVVYGTGALSNFFLSTAFQYNESDILSLPINLFVYFQSFSLCFNIFIYSQQCFTFFSSAWQSSFSHGVRQRHCCHLWKIIWIVRRISVCMSLMTTRWQSTFSTFLSTSMTTSTYHLKLDQIPAPIYQLRDIQEKHQRTLPSQCACRVPLWTGSHDNVVKPESEQQLAISVPLFKSTECGNVVKPGFIHTLLDTWHH